jgi:DNA-binding CsgD family transcriptional regulator
MLAAVRRGESRALVVRGEPGVGKTALLDYVISRAPGRVVRAAGVQSEMELAFAGLHQLCGPMLAAADRLPSHQRDALGIALGASAGPAPNRLLVGLALLGLMSEVARERPLVCVVDDAQWLDRASAQTLAFAARRLGTESVAMIFAVRETGTIAELTGLAELTVSGLSDDDARALLATVLPGRVDEAVLDRIVAETHGNPLALLELPRDLTPAELAGGFMLPARKALVGQIEDTYERRLVPLPPATRRLLLVAAVEPVGDPVLLWRAADRLGIGPAAAVQACAAGLVDFSDRVRFRHPLVRSAIYRAASPQQRRSAHAALAASTDPETDPDRRAWHAAHAAAGPDEDVAAGLEASADRARARGGLAAAAAFLGRASELTPQPAHRARRALAAAEAMHRSGTPSAALRLLSLAAAVPADEVRQARVQLLRAQITFALNRGSDAPRLLLDAATRLAPLDVRRSRETYVEALTAAIFAGPLACTGTLHEVARAARVAPVPAERAYAHDLLLEGLAVVITEGYVTGAPLLQRAVSTLRSTHFNRDDGLQWFWLASRVSILLWDVESWHELVSRHIQRAREFGALPTLALALNSRVTMLVLRGDLAEATTLVGEVEAVTRTTASSLLPYGALVLAAWRGREAHALSLIEATVDEAMSRGEGLGLTVTAWAKALLWNSLGRYDDALAAAEQGCEYSSELAPSSWAVCVELVESATRSGNTERAEKAIHQLSESARTAGTAWALGIETRSRALVRDGAAAEALYREAIDHLGRTSIKAELARAHLLYGEWLIRKRRRSDARDQLHTAHRMFASMGMDAFTLRAERELREAGARLRKRTAETGSELSAQEAHIACLVREGLSNPQIAARLYVSPRTVEWHLSRIFSKLGISSRAQLMQ